MPRLRIDLTYDGSFFHGWAVQPGLRTVEGVLTQSLETILQRPVKLTVAGRTDAGVHAREQVAHLDVADEELLQLTVKRIQGLLAKDYASLWRPESVAALSKVEASSGASDVLLRSLTVVDDSFDARFAALERSYCYRLADSPAEMDPIRRTDVWWWLRGSLEVDQMQEAGSALLGEHDFLSFAKPREGATTVRRVTNLLVCRGTTVEVHVSADAFCHSMVRSIVGALVEVGRGKRDSGWINELLAVPSRKHGVPIAPARGLTLEKVSYPHEAEWAKRVEISRNFREGAHIF